MFDFYSTPIMVTVILGAVGLAIPVIDAIKRERGSNNKLYSGISFGTLALVIGIILYRVLAGEPLPSVEFGPGLLADDMFGSFFAITFLIVSVMVTASSWSFMKGKSNPAAYYSLILLSSIGMVLIAYSTDLVMLLVSWELMSIPTYALAAFSKRDPVSNEAAIKYFMFGALSSAYNCLSHRSSIWYHRDDQHWRCHKGVRRSATESHACGYTRNSSVHSRLRVQNGPCSISYVAS